MALASKKTFQHKLIHLRRALHIPILFRHLFCIVWVALEFFMLLLFFFFPNVLGNKHTHQTATENLVPKTGSWTKILTAEKFEQEGRKQD